MDASPKQVQGLISGLAKGAVYENLLGRGAGTAHNYWAPFTVGILVVVALILVGGGMNAITSLMSRKQEEKEGGQ